MAAMRDIRRRIKTVKNIQQITKALEMVAAARLQKAEQRARAAHAYADEIEVVMGHLASVSESIEHPLIEVREIKKVGVVLITSDRGMAGSYNSNVIRRVQSIAGGYDKEQTVLITVGKKGRQVFGKLGYEIIGEYPMPSSEVSLIEAKDIAKSIRTLFEEKRIDTAHVVYTKFHSTAVHKVTDVQLLPVTPHAVEWGSRVEEYLFEPRPEILLGNLITRYVDTEVYRAMLDSLASEHGARMTAMHSATENAVEMIDRLTLDLNRARQAAITKELAEIVSGAEALK